MNQAPCPNCGEMVTFREEEAGQQVHCPKCKVLLQLDREAASDGSWRRLWRILRRQRVALGAVGALVVFIAGLGVGFGLGRASVPTRGQKGVNATSFSVFGVSHNEINVNDDKPRDPKE
jgi:hypothetical protein